MHGRRFACFILGMWLGGCLLMDFVWSRNGKLVDTIIKDASPDARVELKALGPDARALLAYHAVEEVRWYRKNWDLLQIAAGIAFFLVLLFGSRDSGPALIGMLIVVLLAGVQRFLITPESIMLGRLVDFLPAAQGIGERNRLLVLQTGYWGAEAAKCLAIVVLGGRMVFSSRSRGRSKSSRDELDRVYKPDYRGINR